MKKEVDALRRLRHPRLVRFLGACVQPPLLLVVTEFMAGGSLHDRLFGRSQLAATSALGPRQRWLIACQTAEGLSFLHSQRVVHRDLKSMNILLDAGQNAKICDFGLAHQMCMESTHIARKLDGEGGSPRYMAPECYDASVGKLTDAWGERRGLRSDCLFPISLEAAQLAQAAGEDFRNSPRLSCFCTQQANLDTFLRIPGYRKTPAGQICEEWAWYQGTQMGIRAGGVLAVMIINNILLLVFAYLDSLGRYQTATDLASSQVFNLFFATLVNTAIVYNLIGMNFYTSSNNVFGALRFGQGPFDDLTPLWFLTIGNMLVITIVCQAACSVVLPVLWIWTVDPALRWFFARDTHSQELLNEYHIFPEWTLSLRVAETLVIVFCVFMYSSGFPILYLCGSLYCFLAYWGDKYTLLRGSRRPPGYTKSAIESAVVMMPFAIVFHAVFGLDWGGLKGLVEGIIGIGYAYYNEIMEVVAKGGFDVRGGNYNQYLQARMVDSARAAAEPLLWLFFAQLFYYALVILHWIFRPCIGNTKGLLSYRMDANPNYEEAMVALKFDPDAETPHHKKVDKKQSGVSFSKFEEQLERTVATKMHNAEVHGLA
eukprot:g32784.t1